MIDKQSGRYHLICDICGEESEECFDGFGDFYDAVQYKKDNGWKSQKRNGQWEDVCPDCQEG